MFYCLIERDVNNANIRFSAKELSVKRDLIIVFVKFDSANGAPIHARLRGKK
jgi:hypothetical protein